MIRRLGEVSAELARRWVPDPFVFALLLTFAAFALGLLFGDGGALELARDPARAGAEGGLLRATAARGLALALWWQDPKQGFWKLLDFAMQMCLILVTGHALAASRPVAAAIDRMAAVPRTTAQAAALVALVAVATSLLHWGLGLIVGALFAREVGAVARERGVKLHYPLVGAAGYVGLMVWHGGLSGSAPLKMTLLGDVASLLGEARAKEVGTIPLDRTIWSPLNLAVDGLLLLAVPLLFYLLAPREGAPVQEASDAVAEAARRARERRAEAGPATPAERLERSLLLPLSTALLGAIYLAHYFRANGVGRLDPNAVNATFLFLGLALHGSVKSYLAAVNEAAAGCGGIILQFPFYAGIMGIMERSGLVREMADLTARVATPATFPLLTFAAGSLVNLFIPSGGGQWAVQGPVVVDGAQALGVPVEKGVMALAYGDEYTNMLQPFWALPLLGITGLEAREIMGYTMAVMLLSAPCYAIPLLLL